MAKQGQTLLEGIPRAACSQCVVGRGAQRVSGEQQAKFWVNFALRAGIGGEFSCARLQGFGFGFPRCGFG